MTHVVFDIGAVLVEWTPHLAWADVFATETEAQAFLDRTGFFEKNVRADGGATFAALASEIDDPGDAALFADYVARFARTVQKPIQGTWDILDRLRAQGTGLHAITNWSAETWPEGLKVHPRLGAVFQTLVVSGQEHVSKPDPKIFHLLCARAGLAPADCVFIDDSHKNVAGAQSVGMDAIRFTTPPALEAALTQRGIL